LWSLPPRAHINNQNSCWRTRRRLAQACCSSHPCHALNSSRISGHVRLPVSRRPLVRATVRTASGLCAARCRSPTAASAAASADWNRLTCLRSIRSCQVQECCCPSASADRFPSISSGPPGPCVSVLIARTDQDQDYLHATGEIPNASRCQRCSRCSGSLGRLHWSVRTAQAPAQRDPWPASSVSWQSHGKVPCTSPCHTGSCNFQVQECLASPWSPVAPERRTWARSSRWTGLLLLALDNHR